MTIDEDPSGATQIYNPDDPSAGQWSVNVSDDDTRTMAAHEVAFELSQGTLDNDDTYVWREGMDDWIPLGQCSALQAELQQYRGGAAPPPPQAADDDDDLAATVMVDTAAALRQGGGTPGDQEVSRTMASPLSDPYARPPEAAQRPPVAAEANNPAAGVPQADGLRRVGERNEASSLFSLNDIHAANSPLAAGLRKQQPAKADVDDIFNFSAGLGGGGIAAAFAPPPMNAPAPPPPPTPEPLAPAMASAAPAAFAAARLGEPQKKSRLGMILGLSLGVLLIVVAAVGLLLSQAEDKPTAQNDSASSASTGDHQAAGSQGDTATAESTESPSEGDTTTASDTSEAGGTEPTPGDSSKSASTKGGHVATKDSTKKDTKKSTSSDDKTTAKKHDKKKETKSEPAAEFNVNAARSALGGAAGAASGCKKKGGPTGKGRATVTFAPSGRATQAIVGPPFAGTSVGSCAAAAFRRASVPPFSGSPMTVSKSFYIR